VERFSRFFIDRPIFAAVLSILITVAGGISLFMLPIAQYPQVAPPTVQVDCNYPGANADVVAKTVAAPIEQMVNGVEDMMYMASNSTADGSYTLTVTFKPGVNLNMASVRVQNRVNLALPSLPDVVRQTGVTTKKRSPDILLTVSLNSPDRRYDQLYLSNYAALHLRDELARLPGISEVLIFGQRDFSQRAWLDPDLMATRKITVNDVIAAIRTQNLQIAAGQVGQPPTPQGQVRQIPLSVQGRLITSEEFGDIVVRSTPDGRILRLKDIARVELSARSFDVANRFDRKPTVGLAVFQLPDANALATADLIKAKMKILGEDFPPGMIYEIGYDTTPFIRESIEEVVKALRDSIILVALVVLVFLQGWRAAIIPLIAVPVAIIGTFAAMLVVGFSINNLTLFGLVLAIGIVVDDAIVVVEAVEHYIEQGMRPRAAAQKAMDDVSGPVIAVGLVLSAVFIPCAFISGIVGMFFRQFALTIAISTLLSTFNSLTLSPALAALLLRSPKSRPDPVTWLLNVTIGKVFQLFNWGMNKSRDGYGIAVSKLVRVPLVTLVIYGGLVVLTMWTYKRLPTGFIPIQDKGYLMGAVQLPDSTAAIRTRDIMDNIERILLETDGVKNINAVAGNSFVLSSYGSNFGSAFIILKDFADRTKPEQRAEAIIGRLTKRLAEEVPEARVDIYPAPVVSGLGRAGGFRLMVEDRGDLGLTPLQQQTDNLVDKLSVLPQVGRDSTVYKASSPQLFANVDREACLANGLEMGDVFATLQGYLGSRYINDFNRFGRTWSVIIQADSRFRDQIEDVRRLTVRSRRGEMVPLGAVADIKLIGSPLTITRYNMYPAAAINGVVKEGYSTGQAIAAIEDTAERELPPRTMGVEWTEITYLERTSGNTGLLITGISIVAVFLVLAALYESWALPLAVILVMPMCVLCSLAGVAIAKQDINIFTQIGFVVLIGLASKNAILIVEFAKLKRDEGVDRYTAVRHACELRLRPILMTSFAFILGVVPLVFARGAGAEMRRALGTAVFSGMIGVTLFGIFLTPVFFVVVDMLASWRSLKDGRLARFGRRCLALISPRQWVQSLRRRPVTTARTTPATDTKPAIKVEIIEAPPGQESDFEISVKH